MDKPRHTLSVIKKTIKVPLQTSRAPVARPALAALSHLIIVDRYGCIRSCGQEVAALAGVAAQQVIGKPVTILLPSFPIRTHTPGYNIAFTVFHAKAASGARFNLASSRGAPVTVSVHPEVLEIRPEYLLALKIKRQVDLPLQRAA